MRSNMMKIKEQIAVVLVALAISFSWQAFAINLRPNADVYSLANDYHDQMNDFFNEKFDAVKEVLEDPRFFNDEEFQKIIDVPENIAFTDTFEMALEKCQEAENLSSYCISLEATINYDSFRQTAILSLDLKDNRFDDIEKMTYEIQERSNFINREIDRAYNAMSGSLDVYDEFLKAYPMHIKYQEIYGNLVMYRQLIKDIRTETDLYESKFVNVSSSQCQ